MILKSYSSPNELRDLIYEKNKLRNKARIVAGYCWDWISKADDKLKDIQIPEHNFSMRWNLASDGGLWVLQPESVKEVGCIHTCQGLELDYIGVIIGEDLICRNEEIMTDVSKRSSMDGSVKGYKKLLEENPEIAKTRIDAIIKNTYRTLMTRGMKGCYVYCVDHELEAFLKSRINPNKTKEAPLFFSDVIKPQEEELIKIEESIEKQLQYTEYLPVYDLEAACGYFGNGSEAEPKGWTKIDSGKLNRNMFVSKVVGKSMEPMIPDGSYCLFQANVVGSRSSCRAVLAQWNTPIDSDTGGKYTVKKYTSKKKYEADGSWEHEEITLLPINPAYKPIVIPSSNDGEFMVIAEFLRVVS